MEAQRASNLVDALASDYRRAELETEDRALLDYAVRLTLDPAGISRSDIERLRAHGFADRAIHDICAITAYYAFANRVADGLGVETEVAERPLDSGDAPGVP